MCIYPLVQREQIGFILNPFIEHKPTLNPANNIETFERAAKKATSWSRANRRKKKKNDNGFIIVTHTSVMFKVQLPVCRPDQEKTVPVQKHLHSLRLLFNHTSSVHSDHFAHV